MTAQQIFKKIKDRWEIKVICLVIAFFIYIFHQVSMVESKTFSIPLKLNEDGAVMNVGEVPSTVNIKVKTNAENISKILNSDIKAYLDLNQINNSGNYRLPVNITLSNKLVEFDPLEISIRPEFIHVKVEKKAAKFVPLEPTLVGEVARGYQISNIELDPSFVEIRGPESVLSSVEYLQTSSVNVSNAKNSFSAETDYLQIDKRFTVVYKGKIKVTVTIEPIPYEREFSNVKILSQSLDNHLKLAKDIGFVNLILTGSMPVLENFKLADNYVFVNLAGIHEPGTYELPIQTKKLNGIQLKEISLNKVNVELDIADTSESLSLTEGSKE